MPLDVFQKVFALSFASNLVRGLKGKQEFLQKALDLAISIAIRYIGSEWKVVWGPIVWKHDPEDAESGPDNAWYIAYHPALEYEDGTVHPTYVIAIAATPKNSLYVWFEEDFKVLTVSDFNAWVAGGIENDPKTVPRDEIVQGGAYIAAGTVNTTHTLLTTEAPEAAVSSGMTLLEFITSVDKSASPRFISTGHSLGGALSPSLALTLVQAGVISAENTLAYPTAGASPGNEDFTALFEKTLPPRKLPGAASYQGWNANLVNRLDIVPQAWAPDGLVSPHQNLLRIPTLYGEPAVTDVKKTAWLAVFASRKSGVLYQPISSQYFRRFPAPSTPTTLAEFLQTALQQHFHAYLDEFGLDIPLSTSDILIDGVTEKSAAEKLYNDPVIIDYEWAFEHPKRAQEILDEVSRSTEAKSCLSGVELQDLLAVDEA